MTLDWKKLLGTTRIRRLLIGELEVQPSSDHRSPVDSDYDRVVFSTPLRRLQDKAQVFPLEPNDSIRTRLTHSLEVSTVSRDIARAVAVWLRKHEYIEIEQALEIETIAATCGLIHDLGNPPFGHSGEDAIRSWFALNRKEWETGSTSSLEEYRNDFLQFEGNAQTLRLVSKLQMLTDFHGLNLTAGTMSAACKYVASSNDLNRDMHERSKVGYFHSEEGLIESIRKVTGTGDARNPITYLVEAADDIVYSIVDIADAIKKRVLSWRKLRTLLSETDAKRIASKSEEMVTKCDIPMDDSFAEEACMQWFHVFVFRECVPAAIDSFTAHYHDIMEGKYHGELVKDSTKAAIVDQLKHIAKDNVYCAEANLAKEIMGRRVIHDLMTLFWEGIRDGRSSGSSFSNKIYCLLSKNYRAVFEHEIENSEIPERYHEMQLLTDYISGMTDQFACTLHRELFGS